MLELNLLSPERKKMLREGLRSHLLTILFSWILIIFFSDAALMFGAQRYLQGHLASLQNELANTKVVSPTGKTLPVIELTKQINQQLNTLKNFSHYLDLAQQMTDIAQKTPEGISLSSHAFSAKDRSVILIGTAASRNDIPQFEKAIESLSYVDKLTTLTNLNERTKINFTTTVTLDATGTKQ